MSREKVTDAITVTGAERIPTEIMADAIVKLSETSARLLASGLNRRALHVLLKDASGVAMSDISKVLNVLPQLATLYTIPKKAKR